MPESKRNIPSRPEIRERYDGFAARKRLKLVEVSDLAITALESLPKEQLDALIERRPESPKRKQAVA